MLVDCRKRRTLLNILLAAEERNIPVQYVTYQELDKMGKLHAVSTIHNTSSLGTIRIERTKTEYDWCFI